MAVSTTQSIWRSGGGDQTRVAYCGSGLMIAQFYIPDLTAAAGTNVQVSSTNTAPVILPANAVITSININLTVSGGTNPTIVMGVTGYGSGTKTNSGILANYPVTSAKTIANWTTATAGTLMTAPLSATEQTYITAGTGTGTAGTGTGTGYIHYFVIDPYGGQQNV
jgi:hypothetical protein